MTKHRRN